MSNQSQTANSQEKKILWPDFSAYGIYFCVMPINGKSRMVMVDTNNWYPSMARSLKFQRVPKYQGVYIRDDLKLSFPKKWIEASFPKMKNIETTMSEIIATIKRQIVREKSNIHLSAISGKITWNSGIKQRPVQTVLGRFNLPAESVGEVLASVQNVLKQTSFLGVNFNGESVYEDPLGVRFVSENGQTVIRREGDGTFKPAEFLRAPDAENFELCVRGIVHEMACRKKLVFNDVERYLGAMFGEVDQDVYLKFQHSLDRAICAVAGERQDLDLSMALHENRPPSSRTDGSLPTPAPLSHMMQDAVNYYLSKRGDEQLTVLERSSFAGEHSFLFDEKKLNLISVTNNNFDRHAVYVGGVFGEDITPYRAEGISLNRNDFESVVRSLERRDDNGLSVFLLATEKGGNVNSEARRVMSWVGSRYEILGMTDIDSTMVAPGNKINSRLIVVGNKKPSLDLTYSPPVRINVALDYGQLSGWFVTAKKLAAGEEAVYPSEYLSISNIQENSFQAPYIPASMISEPAMMIPRNLLSPIRYALNRISEESGMDIDEYVASKLGLSMDELSDGRFSAEQIDAIALGISSIDKKMGFVEADQTGAGKGRVIAALMLYSKRIGKKPFFITENPDLFNAIYRDIMDIKALDEFKNPMVMGSNVRILSQDNKVIARSVSKADLQEAFATQSIPDKFDIVLATYGQFNRKPPLYIEKVQAERAEKFNRLRSNGECFYEINRVLNLVDTSLFNNKILQAEIETAITSGDDLVVATACQAAIVKYFQVDPDDHDGIVDKGLVESIWRYAESMKLDGELSQMTLRQDWVRSLEGHILFSDESHNMAGISSQIGENMKRNILGAHAVAYSSATFASKEDNYGIYSRIFPSVIDTDRIADTLKKGGEPLAEIFSSMLTSDMRLVRREHDMSNVEITTFIDDMRREQNTVLADQLAGVLNGIAIMSGDLEQQISNLNKEQEQLFKNATKAAAMPAVAGAAPVVVSSRKTGFVYNSFASRFWMVNQQFLMSLNAKHVADLAVEALSNGLKPVMYAENTFESIIRDAYAKQISEIDAEDIEDVPTQASDTAEDANSETVATPDEAVEKQATEELATDGLRLDGGLTFKRVLHNYVDNLFYAFEIEREGKKVISKKKIDLLTPEREAAVAELRKMIEAMDDVHVSPIDVIRQRITEHGFTVDEISGRKMMVEDREDGTYVINRPQRVKKDIRDDFNNGVVDALVISKSGATGIDLQAGSKFADQRQRVFIPIKLPDNIVKFTQAMGRVNRKDQVCSPRVYLPYIGLPGERRYMVMFKQKLRKMNANVAANAETEKNEDYDAPDIINRIGNKICCEFLAEEIDIANRLGFSESEIKGEAYKTITDPTAFIDRVTSRISLLQCAQQEYVYNEIEKRFLLHIEKCEADGFNPLSAHKYDIGARMTNRELIMHGDENSDSIFSGPVYATQIEYEYKDEFLDGLEPSPEDRTKMVFGELEHFNKQYTSGDMLASLIDGKLKNFLPSLLSKDYNTVEEALNSSENNRIKMVSGRVSGLTKLLPLLLPGTQYTISSEAGSDTCLITSVNYPHTPSIDVSEYRIRVISPKHRRGAYVSVSVLAEVGITDVKSPMEPDANQRVLDFFTQMKESNKSYDTRVVLTGNLYRAAEFAASQNKGSPATYSDENGVWHQVIMMANGMKLQDVLSMPMEVRDAEMIVEFFKMRRELAAMRAASGAVFGSSGNFYSSFICTGMGRMTVLGDQKNDVRIYSSNPGEYEIHVIGTDQTFSALLNNKDVLATLGGSFNMDGSHSYSMKILDSDPNYLEKLALIIKQSSNIGGGLRIDMNTENRAWFMEREAARNKRRDLDDVVDIEFDVDSLLDDTGKKPSPAV